MLLSQLHPAGYRGVVVCNNDIYGSSQSIVGTAKKSINIIDISNVYSMATPLHDLDDKCHDI